MKQLQDIMTLIGKKRFIMLIAVAIIAGGLGGLWQKVMLPRAETAKNEKSTIDAERSRLQREMEELPLKYKELQENEAKYDALMKTSFVSPQDRIAARARMDVIRREAGLRGINYTIAPQEVVAHPESQNIDGTFVRSAIKVDLKGLSDIEMRDFMQRMHTNFGGLVLLKKTEMKLEKPLSKETLRQLQDKTPVDFVTGKADFEWYTIVPKPAEEQPAEGM